MTKKLFLAALAAVLTAGAVNAQVTVSGGLALSYMEAKSDYGTSIEGDIGIGGNIYADYLLPIGIPMSLGVEVGVDTSSFKIDSAKDTVLAIPILARVAYHFDIMPKLDLYLVGKIGYAFGIWNGDTKDVIEKYDGSIDNKGGLAFGFDVGVAFYFTPTVGIFAEGGFDDYMLESEFKFPGEKGEKLEVPFYRFFTVGLSLKF
jgi:opacity protein-like surface antigen